MVTIGITWGRGLERPLFFAVLDDMDLHAEPPCQRWCVKHEWKDAASTAKIDDLRKSDHPRDVEWHNHDLIRTTTK